MAKRLTDTEKWKDDWFLSLSNDYRMIWLYMLDNCSHAGILKKSFGLMNYCCNTKVTEQEFFEVFKDRVKDCGNYYFIAKFIIFQYNDLTSNKPVVVSVRKELERLNIEGMITEPLSNDCLTIKDKSKSIDKDIDHTTNKNIYAVFEEAIFTMWNVFCDEYPVLSKIKEISGKRRDKIKKRFEVASFRDFEQIIDHIKKQDFLLGKNDRGWVASFDWLIENDTNYIKVLEEKYKGLSKEHFESPVDRLTRIVREGKSNAAKQQ